MPVWLLLLLIAVATSLLVSVLLVRKPQSLHLKVVLIAAMCLQGLAGAGYYLTNRVPGDWLQGSIPFPPPPQPPPPPAIEPGGDTSLPRPPLSGSIDTGPPLPLPPPPQPKVEEPSEIIPSPPPNPSGSIDTGAPFPLPPPPPGIEPSNTATIKIFFGTDRRPFEPKTAWFGDDAGEVGSLAVGWCDVSVPRFAHRIGLVERPTFWTLNYSDWFEDPNRHFVITRRTTMDEGTFWRLLSVVEERGDKKQILLFVHGYNVTFEDAYIVVRNLHLT
jgi:hypothetical protein